MFLLILAYLVSIPTSIFYIRWFNTHFDKTSDEYFQSGYVPFLFMPIVNIFACLVASIILLNNQFNKDNKFKIWWDGDK